MISVAVEDASIHTLKECEADYNDISDRNQLLIDSKFTYPTKTLSANTRLEKCRNKTDPTYIEMATVFPKH